MTLALPNRSEDALNEVMTWSRYMSTGNLLPRQYQNNPANLMFAAEFADSLGVSRIHALTSITVINGKPTANADLMAAMVRTHGHKLRVVGDDTYAEVQLIRHDDPDFTFVAHWDINKAKKAGLWGNKGPWTNYPAAMLRARAISEVVRMGAQDVMAGAIYTPEELGAEVDGEGNVLSVRQEATRADQHQQQAPQQPQRAPQEVQQQAAQRTQQAQDALANVLGATPVEQPAEQPAQQDEQSQAPQTLPDTPTVDEDGYPTLTTYDNAADQHLNDLVAITKSLTTMEALQAHNDEFYPGLSISHDIHAQAFVAALETRAAELAQANQ